MKEEREEQWERSKLCEGFTWMSIHLPVECTAMKQEREAGIQIQE